MMEALAEWVRTLAIGAVFVGAVLALAPEGSEKRAVKLVCGAVMTLLLIAPLKELNAGETAWQPAELRLLRESLREEAGQISREAAEAFIRAGAEEYILDAAGRLGILQPGVRLSLQGEGTASRPWAAELTGICTEEQRMQLSMLLEGELGIPTERQIWSGNNAG